MSTARSPAVPRWWQRCDWVLLGLLAVSLVIRVCLIWKGGQRWFPDESRYLTSREAWLDLRDAKIDEFIKLIFSRGDHLGFKLLMIPVAMLEDYFNWSFAPPALLGSGIFSVGSIAMIYGLARRLGAGVEEARWAAFFAACTNALFYWSRHLMPYDMALFLGLVCLYVGLHPAPRWYHSLLAGFLGFACFVVYNGYWLIVAFALSVHVLLAWPPWRKWKTFLLRGLLGWIGLFGSFAFMVYWADWKGLDLNGSYSDFSNSINQGDFNDGHYIIAAYLWSAERLFTVLWLAALAWFLGLAARRRKEIPLRAWIWLGGVLGLGATLVIFSNGLETFVVYGRLVRQLTPFLALVSAWAVTQWVAARRAQRWGRPVLVAGTLTMAAVNFHASYDVEFGFTNWAREVRDDYRKRSGASEATRIPLMRFRIISYNLIWPWPPDPPQLPPHEVLLFSLHPARFRPYLFEGYNRAQRAAIETTDIDSYLVLLKN